MRPLTAYRPKALLPVAGKALMHHTLEALAGAGIREATILVGWQGRRLKEHFGRGDSVGVRLTYEEQLQARGTADAVGLARSHVNGPFLSVNGDLVVSGEAVRGLLDSYQKKKAPIVGVVRSERPEKFGVVEVENDRVVRIEEKPKAPKSDLVNAGVYVFEPDIFPLIDATPRSARGEFEITDTIRMLTAKRDVYAYRLPGPWIDVGTPWDLLAANAALLKSLKGAVRGDVSPKAHLEGEVVVEEGARVLPGAYLRGPTIVGRDAEVGPNCFVRPSTSLGARTKVGNACEVKNSIVMDETHIPHQNYVGDSVIGERCNLGAGTRVANLRLDEDNIKVSHRGRVLDTGLRKLGVIMGDDVKVGIGASLDVGTIIGEETFIGPGAVVHGNVAPRSRIF